MAQPTVRIHPPKRGDEDWLASMIAPLLDMSSDLLAQGFAMGPISVGDTLSPDEASDLVDVLKGFGAHAECIDGKQRRAPLIRPPSPSQTQPFDGGHLRRMLAAAAPTQHASQPIAHASVPPKQSPAKAPPAKNAPLQRQPRRRPPAKAPVRRESSPVASPSARPSAGPPPRVSQSTAEITPPARKTSPTSPLPAIPSLSRRPRTSAGPKNTSAQTRTTGDVPPWFPQVPMRPEERSQTEKKSGAGWVWILLIMALAAAAAWYMQTTV